MAIMKKNPLATVAACKTHGLIAAPNRDRASAHCHRKEGIERPKYSAGPVRGFASLMQPTSP
jgi:hypothetical protein